MNTLKTIENELVPVYETSTGEKVVYGTELHAVLEVKSRYREWIDRRFADIDAVENEDFEAAEISAPSGQTKKDHIIKLDTAKEMAMLERNEKGKQVRRYFIRIEKKYKELEFTQKQILSVEDAFRLVKLVNETTPDKLPIVCAIFLQAGVHIPEIHSFYADSSTQRKYSTNRKTPVYGNVNNHIKDFLQGMDVINRPTSDVYQEYVAWCSVYGINPVSKIVLPKMINKVLGTRVTQKKLNRINKKVFSC